MFLEKNIFSKNKWNGRPRHSAEPGKHILFQDLTICLDTYICELSLPKIAVPKVL